MFAKLKNLRRARGLQGVMKSGTVPGTDVRVFMTEDWSSWSALPTTLKVEHDGFEGEGKEIDAVSNGEGVVNGGAINDGHMNGNK